MPDIFLRSVAGTDITLRDTTAADAVAVTWNSVTKSPNITLSNGDLTASGAIDAGAAMPTPATKIVTTGKFYFEVEVTAGSAFSGVSAGISDGAAHTNFTMPGSANARAVSYDSNSTLKRNGGSSSVGLSSWENAGTYNIGVAVDAGADLVWFRLNGTWVGDPAAGTGGFATFMTGGYAALVSPTRTDNSGVLKATAASQTYGAPSGFSAYDSAAPVTLAGTSTVAFTASASITGIGQVAGTSSPAFTPIATIQGKGAVSGATSVTFNTSGAVQGRGAIAGASAVTFTPSAAITGRGAVSGASSPAFTASAAIAGKGQIGGSLSASFTATAAVTSAPASGLSGSANITTTVSGTITGIGQVSGSAAIEFSASARVTRPSTIIQIISGNWAESKTATGANWDRQLSVTSGDWDEDKATTSGEWSQSSTVAGGSYGQGITI